MFTTVKVPLMDDQLSPKKHQQLERLTARDTTVIRRYLEIIALEEDNLWRPGWEGKRLSKGKVDALTLTSESQKRTQKDGTVRYTQSRATVKYDLKAQFGKQITVRELKECRDTAVEMWHSYREKVADHERIYWRIMQKTKYVDREDALASVLHWWATEKKPHPPCQAEGYTPHKLPRRANVQTTCFWHERLTKLTRYWLEVYFPERGKHLWLPLNPSSYHLNQLRAIPPKTIQLVKHRNGRWYAHVTIALKNLPVLSDNKPLAVVSLDLGMNKSAVAVLLTEDHPGTLHRDAVKYFEQKAKKQVINELDNRIASLQRTKAHYETLGKPTKNVLRVLKRLAHKRRELALHYDHVLTAEMVAWVQELAQQYTVHVVLGKLKGIRWSRRKGDGGSRKHRRELHRWAFARLTAMLAYKLQRTGLPPAQFHPVKEAWTSRTCSRCGSTRTSRPFQALVICLACGRHLQADENGALNIAFKLIVSLDEATLDHWLPLALLQRKYPKRQRVVRQSLTKASPLGAAEEPDVSVAGWKGPCSPRTQKASSTSRPPSGNEAPSPVASSLVDAGAEPASCKGDSCKI